MEDAPFGLVEVILVFAAVLAWAAWEVVRNRTHLRRMQRGETRGRQEKSDAG